MSFHPPNIANLHCFASTRARCRAVAGRTPSTSTSNFMCRTGCDISHGSRGRGPYSHGFHWLRSPDPMKLNQALAILKQRKMEGRAKLCFLACGCEPLHLATFLHAHLQERFPDERVEVATGLYGDLLGNVSKAVQSSATAAAVGLEWGDLDPRLGLRSSGGWSLKSRQDILQTCQQRLSAFASDIEKLGQRIPVAIAPPMLPMAPAGVTVGAQA